jgi:hypothetical protein
MAMQVTYGRRAAVAQSLSAITPPSSQLKTEAPHGGAALKSQNSAKLQQQHRERLLEAAIRKHGLSGVGALLRGIEAECGDLAIDRRLEHLIDTDERAVALLDLVGGAR